MKEEKGKRINRAAQCQRLKISKSTDVVKVFLNFFEPTVTVRKGKGVRFRFRIERPSDFMAAFYYWGLEKCGLILGNFRALCEMARTIFVGGGV